MNLGVPLMPSLIQRCSGRAIRCNNLLACHFGFRFCPSRESQCYMLNTKQLGVTEF